MAARIAPALLAPVAFLACTVVWGSTWAAIKVGYDVVPVFTAAALRFLLASALLFAVLAVLRIPLPRGRTEWGLAAFVGVVLFGADYGLIYWGEQYIPSGLTSVLFSTMPLFTLLVAAGVGLERVTARKLGGITLGVAGVAVLFADAFEGAAETPIVPALAILGAAACAAFASVAMKRHGRAVHSVGLMAPAMGVGALVHAVIAIGTGEPLVLPRDPVAWASIGYLALGGSVFTFLTFTWLLKQWDASRVSLLTILTPLIALLLGTLFLGEPVTLRIAGGTALVLTGVGLAIRAGPAMRPAPSHTTDAS